MKDNKKIKKPKSIALLANNKSNTNMSIKDIFKASTTKIKKKKKINYELVDKIISLFKKYNPSFKVKNINKEKSIVNSYIKKYKNNLNDNDFIRLFENSLLLFNNTSSPDTLPCCPSYWFERPNFRKGDKDTFYDWYKNKNWNKKIENSKTKILSDFEYNSRFKEEYDKIKSILKSRSNEKTNIAFINYLFDWYDKNIKQKYIYYNNKKYYYQDIMNCHFGSWKMHLNTNGSFVYFFLKFLNDRIDEKQTKENVKENEIWNPNFVNIYIAEFFNYKEISDALNKSEIHKYLVKYLKEKK